MKRKSQKPNSILVYINNELVINEKQLLSFCFHTALKYTRNTEDASDVAMESVIEVLQRAYRYDESKSQDTTWIYSIVYFNFIDLDRKNKKNRSILQDDYLFYGENGEESFTQTYVETRDNPFEQLHVSLTMESLLKLREQMNPLYFDILWYTEYLGFKGHEVARELGYKYKNTGSYKKRAIEQIRKLMGHNEKAA